MEVESSRDRTKKFEVSRIVEVNSLYFHSYFTDIYPRLQTIFANLSNYEIDNFILFWDFLNKRFFFHLDAEHYNLCCTLKSDLLKYYLVYAVKSRNPSKVTDFFSAYSHEILADSPLRAWYVLPYLEEPDKDGDFAVYFSSRWAELLKITLHNFLSVVLSTAPPPKLLLLEKWYRSEAQQEMRSQFGVLGKKIDRLSKACEAYEERLHTVREGLKLVVSLLHKNTLTAKTNALFDEESAEQQEERRMRMRDLGNASVRTANEIYARSHARDKGNKEQLMRELGVEEGGTGDHTASSVALEEAERELLAKLHEWTALLAQAK